MPKTTNIEVISAFRGKYKFLCNFYEHPFEYAGRLWPTSEHAYQAQKSHSAAEQRLIRQAKSPGHAKRLGRRVALRPDWEAVKVDIMRGVLLAKFALPDLRRRLEKTSPARLIEGNSWGDTFWGVYQGRGHNHLGRLLMEIRDEL